MHEAFTAAGGKAEYHLVPPFGSDGHFFIGSPDAIPIWSPSARVARSQKRANRSALSGSPQPPRMANQRGTVKWL